MASGLLRVIRPVYRRYRVGSGRIPGGSYRIAAECPGTPPAPASLGDEGDGRDASSPGVHPPGVASHGGENAPETGLQVWDNSGHSLRHPVMLATRAEEMAAYDALPPELRAALADAPVKWSAVNMLVRWQRAAAVYGGRRATAAGLRVLREAPLPEPRR